MPFGVGPIATGGATVEVTAALRESMSFVDIYVAFSVSTDPGNLHILNPDGSLQVVPFSMVLQSIVNGTLPPGIGPWIGNTMNSINAVLLGSTPVSQIPPGTYSIYLMRAAAGSLANFDIYSTGFTVPDGTALYAQNCQGCHGALATSSVRGESASNISAAINGGVSQMSGLRSLLSLQVQAIATALQ